MNASLLNVQIEHLLDLNELCDEVAALKAHPEYVVSDRLRRLSGSQFYANSPLLSTLLQWAQLVCGIHNVPVCLL